MDANMGELLDLCSGNFRGSLSDSSQHDKDVPKKDAMDELLGLCSGKFVSQGKTTFFYNFYIGLVSFRETNTSVKSIG